MAKNKSDGELPDRSKERDYVNMKVPAKAPSVDGEMSKLRKLFEDAEKKKKHNR